MNKKKIVFLNKNIKKIICAHPFWESYDANRLVYLLFLWCKTGY